MEFTPQMLIVFLIILAGVLYIFLPQIKGRSGGSGSGLAGLLGGKSSGSSINGNYTRDLT